VSAIFKDEVIYITGASAGIGFATAKLCLEQGEPRSSLPAEIPTTSSKLNLNLS